MSADVILDLREFEVLLTPAGLRRPAAERRLGLLAGSLIEALTAPFTSGAGDQALPIRCPGRHKPRCAGRLHAAFEGAEAVWRCPSCGDGGRISHWQGGPWDLSGEQPAALAQDAPLRVRLSIPQLDDLRSIPVLDRAAERVLATGRRVGQRAVDLHAPEAWLALAEYVASEVNHANDPDFVDRLEPVLDTLERFL